MANAPLRVGLWAPVPPPLGGIGRWTLRYLEAAPRLGLDATVINTAPPPGGFTERSALRLDRARPTVRALSQLAGLLAARKLDVLHATTTLFWATPRDCLALAQCRAVGVPTVLHIHASNQIIAWRAALTRPQRWALDAVLRQASCVLVLSEELESYLTQQLPGLPVQRLGNMVALPDKPHPQVLATRTRRRVLFVGAVTPLKGVTELAQAVLDLPSVELAVVGGHGGAIDPSQGAAMAAALTRLRATGRLVELPEQTPEAVMQAYREADVFCLPSHREGLPNVLLEAMASGLPAVVTPVGAVPEVVRGDLAEVVPVAQPDMLRAALARLLGDAERRADLAQRAQAAVMARYSVDAIMAGYRTIYLALVR